MSFKELIKNPIFYYILIPIVVAIWPLSLAVVYLPNIEKSIQREKEDYKDAEDMMFGILNLDPDRISSNDAQKKASEFDYATAVDQIARSCDIRDGTYSISAQPLRVVDKEKTKNASVILQKIDIKKFADFLSSLQTRWAKLECESIDLTKQRGLPDSWKATIKFKYYY